MRCYKEEIINLLAEISDDNTLALGFVCGFLREASSSKYEKEKKEQKATYYTIDATGERS